MVSWLLVESLLVATLTIAAQSEQSCYTVQPGDNLSKIARNHVTSVAAIMQGNELTSTIIQPGQQLCFAGATSSLTSSIATGTAPPAPDTPTQELTITSAPVQVIPGTSEVTYQSGELELQGYLCIPPGVGPFPAVVYNHGGREGQIGGPPRETCEALAQDGYVGFSPIRRATESMAGHIDDVLAGVDYVTRLEYVDRNRLGIMGFSRGGLLTFMAATRRSSFSAVVIMAPAPGRGPNNLQQSLSDAANVTAPVLILVSENDTAPNDLVQLSHMVKDALEAAGKQATLIMYPPYGNDGHLMFFEIGDYWIDIQQFLAENLAKE